MWLLVARVGDGTRLLDFYQPITDLGLGKRFMSSRVIRRWEAIHENLPSGRLSGLDVGCNVGYYCFEMAKLGHHMWGCEASRPLYLVFWYARERLRENRVQALHLKVTPENIEQLPTFDCVLCMSVFHHWCFHFGTAEALVMLDRLVERTGKVLFFETAQTDETSQRYMDVLPDMGEDPEAWLHQHFLDKGCDRVKTVYSRGRHLLAVYK